MTHEPDEQEQAMRDAAVVTQQQEELVGWGTAGAEVPVGDEQRSTRTEYMQREDTNDHDRGVSTVSGEADGDSTHDLQGPESDLQSHFSDTSSEEGDDSDIEVIERSQTLNGGHTVQPDERQASVGENDAGGSQSTDEGASEPLKEAQDNQPPGVKHDADVSDRPSQAEQEATVDRIMSCLEDDPYALLDLTHTRGVTLPQLRQAYRKLCLLTQPDKSAAKYAGVAFNLEKIAYDALESKLESPSSEYQTDEVNEFERGPSADFQVPKPVTADDIAQARYGRPPRTPFEFGYDGEYTFAKWHKYQQGDQSWGLNSEKRWVADRWGRPVQDPNGRWFPLIQDPRDAENHRFHGPSRLRKSRSVNDLSPEGSPKARSPVSPLLEGVKFPQLTTASGDQGVAPISPGGNDSRYIDPVVNRARSMSETSPTRWADLDDEDDDSWVAEPIAWGSTGTVAAKTDDVSGEVSVDHAATSNVTLLAETDEHAEQGSAAELMDKCISDEKPLGEDEEHAAGEASDGEDDALPSLRAASRASSNGGAERSYEQDISSDNPQEQVGKDTNMSRAKRMIDRLQEDEHQLVEDKSSDSTEPTTEPPRTFGPSDTKDSTECSPTRHCLPTPAANLTLETGSIAAEEEQHTGLSPNAPGISEGQEESAISPTPTSASSVNSTTGVTQSEGMDFADRYDAAPSSRLAEQRLKFKDALSESSNKVADKIMENPQDRIASLTAKVHKLKQMVKHLEKPEHPLLLLQDEADRLKHRINQLQSEVDRWDKKYNELWEEYKRLCPYESQYHEVDKELQRVRPYEQYASNLQGYLDRLEANSKQRLQNAAKEFAKKDGELDSLKQQFNDLCERYDALIAQQNAPVDLATAQPRTEYDAGGTDMQTGPLDRSARAVRAPRQDTARWPQQTWPTQSLDHIAAKIAEWVNRTHLNEHGPDIAELTPGRVSDMLDNGTVGFGDLYNKLQTDGYMFRDDRFAQFIADLLRGKGYCSVEAMTVERRIRPGEDALPRVLEELNERLLRADPKLELAEERTERLHVLGMLEDARGHVYGANITIASLEQELANHQQVIRDLTDESHSDSPSPVDGERFDSTLR